MEVGECRRHQRVARVVALQVELGGLRSRLEREHLVVLGVGRVRRVGDGEIDPRREHDHARRRGSAESRRARTSAIARPPPAESPPTMSGRSRTRRVLPPRPRPRRATRRGTGPPARGGSRRPRRAPPRSRRAFPRRTPTPRRCPIGSRRRGSTRCRPSALATLQTTHSTPPIGARLHGDAGWELGRLVSPPRYRPGASRGRPARRVRCAVAGARCWSCEEVACVEHLDHGVSLTAHHHEAGFGGGVAAALAHRAHHRGGAGALRLDRARHQREEVARARDRRGPATRLGPGASSRP